MRLSRIIDKEPTIFDDKNFVKTFTMLMVLIIAVSLFLIYHSIYQVNDVDTLRQSIQKDMLKLGVVEKELNGNTISLEVLEDNFNEFSEQELLEMAAQERILSKPVVVQHEKEEKVKSASHPKIEITSTPIMTKKSSSPRSLKSLKKKFYATNNPKYALQIAQRFYNAQRYKEALKWSLIANEVDEQKPESWIMFAKTKMKMGKKQDAINVLNAYLKTYTSAKISRYLEKIKRTK